MGLKLNGNKIPDVTFSNLPVSVDEGETISPIISFTTFDDNLIGADTSVNVYWELSGVGIASTDFENVGADGNPDPNTTLTGYVQLDFNNKSRQFPIGIRSDNFADLNVNETATFSIYSDFDRTQLIKSDTFIINDTSMGEPPQFDFLLVGGGGAGGNTGANLSARAGGGGGAGGVLVLSNHTININDTIYCDVAATSQSANNGNDTRLRQSVFGTIIASVQGGGRGAPDDNLGQTAGSSTGTLGGSGGGGSAWYSNSGGTGGSNGNNGGDGETNGGGGGGGGYSSAGESATSLPTNTAGDGGDGYDLSNFLSALTGKVAGGGGGGGYYDGTNGYPAGTGTDGGGDGASNSGSGSDATAYTGSGGGGASPGISGGGSSVSSRQGGRGGSGVIYLKYIAAEPLFTFTDSGGNPITGDNPTSFIVSSGAGTKKYQVHQIVTDGTLTRVS